MVLDPASHGLFDTRNSMATNFAYSVHDYDGVSEHMAYGERVSWCEWLIFQTL